ncbi:MAG: NAD-dependent epimerase/dehydratase family protein [Cyclobacteriaceae bacterium]
MTKKVIITGASGMVGKGVLLECLDHSEIDTVLALGRTPTGIKHSKLIELMVADFTDFTMVRDQLKGYDACYFCLGVSAGGMKESDYKRITYDYTLALGKTLFQFNPGMTFIYVSGQGTDSSEKGRMMWARVKGKTENDLSALGFNQAFMFRPGIIIPLRGIKSKTPGYQFFYTYLGWLFKLIKLVAPDSANNTTQIGLAMINATLYGYDKKIIATKDINALAEG